MNWLQILENQAEKKPHKIAFSEKAKSDGDDSNLSYLALSTRVKALAYIISQQSKFGDRVIILMPNGINYVIAFFACIYAGVIAVPAYPPHKKKRDWERLNCIVQDCKPNIAIYQNDDEQRIASWLTEHQLAITPLTVEQLELDNSEAWQAPTIDKHDIAYLQYSSGSTGNPKGVMLSHANLLNNTQLIINAYGVTANDKVINWLPLYHDMGFVGCILSPIRVGAHIRFLPSAAVAQNPYLLFKAITEHRATVTAAPNFIFDLAVNRISKEEKEQLDLSSLRVFVNGAEPINADTLITFTTYFNDTGLSSTTIKPSYGLAEACLLVACSEINKPFHTLSVDPKKLLIDKIVSDPVSGKNIASSGVLLPEIKVRIVDKNTRVLLPNDCVGEIMIKGDSVTRGYWKKTALNAQTFDQRVNNEYGFMATGDLGFVDTIEGKEHLYVTGRQKEILIINGCNYYPQDIEHSLLSLSEDLEPHGAAIFEVNIDNYSKDIVLVQELTRKSFKQKNHQEIIKKIRVIIAEDHELRLTNIVLLKPATLAKTSSGKIQRIACRDAYLKNQLNSVDSWQQETLANVSVPKMTSFRSNDIAQWIIQWVAVRLSVEISQLSVSQQLTQIGLDSIDAMTLTHELSKQLELTLKLEISWSYPSIKALSDYLAKQVKAKHSQPTSHKTPTEGMI